MLPYDFEGRDAGTHGHNLGTPTSVSSAARRVAARRRSAFFGLLLQRVCICNGVLAVRIREIRKHRSSIDGRPVVREGCQVVVQAGLYHIGTTTR